MNMNPNGTPQTSRWYDQVKAFTEAMGQPVDADVNDSDNRWLVGLRGDLIEEETEEVGEELYDLTCWPTQVLCPSEDIDKAALTKELADLLYVTIGFAVTFGLPLCEVFERVHQSNMSKLGEDGKPIYREDGKVMKGPNYQPPQLDDLF
jgi:NTP pyrophosphatase (non-canonical NTP hydrolase)